MKTMKTENYPIVKLSGIATYAWLTHHPFIDTKSLNSHHLRITLQDNLDFLYSRKPSLNFGGLDWNASVTVNSPVTLGEMAGLGILTQLYVSASRKSTFKRYQTAGIQHFWRFSLRFVFFTITCRITESLSFGFFAFRSISRSLLIFDFFRQKFVDKNKRREKTRGTRHTWL